MFPITSRLFARMGCNWDFFINRLTKTASFREKEFGTENAVYLFDYRIRRD